MNKQPIETAPKDGTPIIAIRSNGRKIGVAFWHVWRHHFKGWYVQHKRYRDAYDRIEPTYWKPVSDAKSVAHLLPKC